MTSKIKGTEGVEFPDGTTQSTAAVPSQLAPAGMLADFAMQTAPVGWLACDGAAVSRTTYASLFAAIGTLWGTGDGSTTFNLPDMRGYFRRGSGTNSDGTASGAFATKQVDDNKQHAHGISAGNTGVGGSTTSLTTANLENLPVSINYEQASGGDESRPKNIAVLTCIKV